MVVQQADREILKLQAQAQAQAVAAAEVSAAAQRAEAEVQKHAQAHAQASATAQQLQAKAVHLQVQAEHLTVEAAAATVSIGAGELGMQRAASSAGLMMQGAVPGLPAVGAATGAAPLMSSSIALSAQVRAQCVTRLVYPLQASNAVVRPLQYVCTHALLKRHDRHV